MEEKDDSFVPELEDSLTAGDPIDVSRPPVKRVRVEYNLLNTFDSKGDAEKFLQVEKIWSKTKRQPSEEGMKQFLRCNRVKWRGKQCSIRAYLLFESSSTKVHFFRSHADHNCDQIGGASLARVQLTEQVKNIIEDMTDMKKKPIAIIDQLTLQKLPTPKRYQISNHIAKYKKFKYGPAKLSLMELRQHLVKFTEVSDDANDPYVIQDISTEDETFRFFFTSRALLENARGAKTLSADATYKLLWQGFPVLLVGTTDMDRKFLIMGVAVCMNEKEADFAFLFESLSKCVSQLLGDTLAPSSLVCDASKAIQNAFLSVFGKEGTTIIMCWFHVHKNVTKKLSTFVKVKATKDAILSDLTFLQLIATVSYFETALDLFLKKWENEADFVAYFKEEWINQNPNWYEGAMQNVPSTNNALEATNRVLKDDVTGRERLSIGEFISVLADMISRYSRRSTTDLKMSLTPSIPNLTWSAAHKWAKENHTLVKKRCPNGDTYISVRSSNWSEHVKSNWASLLEFKIFYNSTWTVTLPSTEKKWLKAHCSCPYYQKKIVCKHVVGISIRMAEVTVPEDAKNILFVAKRKRGRPAKAKKALIIQ